MVRRGRRARVRTASVLVMALTTLLVAGCGADVERQQAGAAADTFAADVTHDPEAACALLAPRTEQAVEEDGELVRARRCRVRTCRRRGGAPRSRWPGTRRRCATPQETVFLALFDDGWRVTAAGCTRTSPDPAVPYDCVVEAG